MRSSLVALALAVFAHDVLTAAPITGAAPGLPGFGSASSAQPSDNAVSPAAAFSVDMQKAFVTDDATLTIGGASVKPTRVAPGEGSTVAGRRVRSIIGVAPNGDASGDEVAIGGGVGGIQVSVVSAASSVPIPEPGTAVIGSLVLGVCANGRRRRAGSAK